jgi:hypothetical protein
MKISSTSDDAFWAILIMGFFGAMSALSYFVTFRRLKEWSQEEGVRVIKRSLRRSGDFYVTVEDREKIVFTGWVKAGGLVATLFSKMPTVIWDNRPDYLKE